MYVQPLESLPAIVHVCFAIFSLCPKVRVTASDMAAFASFESGLNSQYGSDIVTEWPFNGLGILEVVSRAPRAPC